MTLCLSKGPSLPPGDGELTCSHQFQGPPGGDAKGFHLVAYGDISKWECPPMFRDTHMYIYICIYLNNFLLNGGFKINGGSILKPPLRWAGGF